MAALLVSGASALSGWPLAIPPAGWLAAALVAAIIAAGYWGIVTSRTSFDGHRIVQTGPWHRSVAIADITRVMLVRLRGLEGLVVPRLVVRTQCGLTTFHTADPAVLARFEALVGEARRG